MDTEVSPIASVSSIVDSNNKTNVQNEAQDSFKSAESECNISSDDKVTQIVPDTKTESSTISAKAIEVVEQTDLTEEIKSSSGKNASNENIIDVDQSERKGKS